MDDELIKELNTRPWYRLIKVFAWSSLLAVSLFSLWFVYDNDYKDFSKLISLSIVVGWIFIIYGLRRVVSYIAFGRIYSDSKREQIKSKIINWIQRILLRIVWVLTVLIVCFSSGWAIYGIYKTHTGEMVGIIHIFFAVIGIISSYIYLSKLDQMLKKGLK